MILWQVFASFSFAKWVSWAGKQILYIFLFVIPITIWQYLCFNVYGRPTTSCCVSWLDKFLYRRLILNVFFSNPRIGILSSILTGKTNIRASQIDIHVSLQLKAQIKLSLWCMTCAEIAWFNFMLCSLFEGTNIHVFHSFHNRTDKNPNCEWTLRVSRLESKEKLNPSKALTRIQWATHRPVGRYNIFIQVWRWVLVSTGGKESLSAPPPHYSLLSNIVLRPCGEARTHSAIKSADVWIARETSRAGTCLGLDVRVEQAHSSFMLPSWCQYETL